MAAAAVYGSDDCTKISWATWVGSIDWGLLIERTTDSGPALVMRLFRSDLVKIESRWSEAGEYSDGVVPY